MSSTSSEALVIAAVCSFFVQVISAMSAFCLEAAQVSIAGTSTP